MFTRKKQPPIKSLIAEGTEITGDLSFTEGLRLDGKLMGNLRATGQPPSLLVISETAHVQGSVTADHIIVNGRIDGPVKASELLELQPKAQIVGDVQYKAVELHQGAVITGLLQPLSQDATDKPVLKLAANNA